MSQLITFRQIEHTPKQGDSSDFYTPPALHAARLAAAAATHDKFQLRDSVVDVGCGYGDLLPHLQARGLLAPNYTGLDPSESFIEVAANRHPMGNFKVQGINELGVLQYDHVFCLGVAPLLEPVEGNFSAFLNKLLFCARKTLTIEVQNSEVYKGKFFSVNPAEIEAELRQKLTSRTSFKVEGDSVLIVRIELT